MLTRGERSGKCYRIGDSMRIRVYSVDTLSRTIDFIPAEAAEEEEEEWEKV